MSLTEQEITKEFKSQDLSLLKEEGKRNLYFFAKGILGFSWLTPRVHLPLCNALASGAKRVMIELPRGWFKTTLSSISCPLWRGVKNPDIRILLTQNTFTNAVSKLSSIKGLVEGGTLFRALYPEVLPRGRGAWKGEKLTLHREASHPEATFEAAGTRTQVVSRHFDVIIEDDTVAPDKDDYGEEIVIPSSEDIMQAIGYHRNIMPLFTSPRDGINFVVGTRWAELDLLSWVEEHEGDTFQIISRACREDAEGRPSPTGEPTFPERFDEEVLRDLERRMGPYMFACLYLNSPMRAADMTFSDKWFKYYQKPPRDLLTITTVDLASDPADVKGKPDYNVVMTTGQDVFTGNIYILDYFRKHANPGEVIDAIFSHVGKYKPRKVGIESVAYQSSMSYWVKERMKKSGEYFQIEPIRHGKKSKNTRIQNLQPLFSAGKVFMKTEHTELRSELLAFPLAANDDVSDALSMQLPWWIQSRDIKRKKQIPQVSPHSIEHAIKELRMKYKQRRKNIITIPFASQAFYRNRYTN